MNLSSMLIERAESGNPIRVGLIGAGKFGSMFLAQARNIPGLHVIGVADLNIDKARASLVRVHWEKDKFTAKNPGEACTNATTWLTDDAISLVREESVDVVIEATGHPTAGIRHAMQAMDHGKHVIMVNVEADVLCGAVMAERARSRGVVYSMAYGDQPAAICELVDWVRAAGFELVAAGKGMNFAPEYRYSTPETVWDHYGFSEEEVASDDFNPKMFNSFTDGTKSAIEMSAVANATGLDCPEDGLSFHPSGVHDLAKVFKPKSDGGRLEKAGLVDIAASREPDGRIVANHIQYGMFVTFRAPGEYTRTCFRQYGLMTDDTGWYASMWRPFHLIGLETSISVLSAALRGEPTGSTRFFRADAVAAAKGNLKTGDILDGEGGYKVWAKAIPAHKSVAVNALPIGLANNVTMKRDIACDQVITMDDVDIREDFDILDMRKDQIQLMHPA